MSQGRDELNIYPQVGQLKILLFVRMAVNQQGQHFFVKMSAEGAH